MLVEGWKRADLLSGHSLARPGILSVITIENPVTQKNGIEATQDLLDWVGDGLDDLSRGAGELLGWLKLKFVELAESLGNSPARIFSWVHDNIDRGVTAGPGETWLRMDAALVRHELTEGIRVFESPGNPGADSA